MISVFTLLSFFYLVLVNLTPELVPILVISKVLPIYTLAYMLERSGLNSPEKKYAYIALLFSSVGDGLLAVEGKFIFGLGGFLVAQIFYITAFSQSSKANFPRALPFYISGIAIMSYLIGFLDPNLRVPVIVYVTILMTMGWRAASRETNGISYTLTTVGACIFILSDSLIAFTEFAKLGIPYPHLWVMITYYLAQFLIIMGILQKKVPD
jgi:uncharacterized membrane protein YhhN